MDLSSEASVACSAKTFGQMREEKDGGQWYALRTQVKREALAAKSLEQLDGVEVFLPRLRYQKSTKRGPVWWIEALFPGYLLAHFDFSEMGRAVGYARGVSKVVTFGGAPPPVPETLVAKLREEVQRLEDRDGLVTVRPQLQPDEEVEVVAGPLKGTEAKVLAVRSGGERVRLLVNFLGTESVVEVSLLDLVLEERVLPKELTNDAGQP